MKRALVTGGAGPVGAHLVRQLAERGVAVRVRERPDANPMNLDALALVVPGDPRAFAQGVENVRRRGTAAHRAIVSDRLHS